MRRDESFEEISDGKLYGINDMVKADCHDCAGCSACCRGMGNSIVLTPYDVYLMTTKLGCSFEQLLAGKVALNVYDGVILPALAMADDTESCAFLDDKGRCSIHPIRPGICRLFPLGRIYREDGFDYFLQVGQCMNDNRTKIKVSKWLDTPELAKNEAFIWRWHELVKNLQQKAAAGMGEEELKKINLMVLNLFYLTPYDEGDFYNQIETRFAAMHNKS